MAKTIEKSFTTNIKVSINYQLPEGIIADYNISNLKLKFGSNLNLIEFNIPTYFIEERTGEVICTYGLQYPESTTFEGKSKKVVLELYCRSLDPNRKAPGFYLTRDRKNELFKMINKQGKMIITITTN